MIIPNMNYGNHLLTRHAVVTRNVKILTVVTIMPNATKILPLLRNENEQSSANWGND